MDNSFRKWLKMDEKLSLKGDYKGTLFQRLVAAAYQIAPEKDASTIPLYRDLWNKIQRQNSFLQHDFEFVPDSGDHYRSLKQLKKSIQQQRDTGTRRAKMFVYSREPGPEGSPEQQGHPTLTNDENVVLRGVHDAIAHLAGNHPFSARGEYGAYNRHLKTMCNIDQAKDGKCQAAKVLFTEIVGQTSYYYIYGGFPPQKAVVLTDFDHYNIGILAKGSHLNEFFQLRNKELIQRENAEWESFYDSPIGREFSRQEDVSKFVGLSKIDHDKPIKKVV